MHVVKIHVFLLNIFLKMCIFFVYFAIASMKGLERLKGAENIINRKISIFYIEAVLNFFFQLRKIFFLSSIDFF